MAARVGMAALRGVVRAGASQARVAMMRGGAGQSPVVFATVHHRLASGLTATSTTWSSSAGAKAAGPLALCGAAAAVYAAAPGDDDSNPKGTKSKEVPLHFRDEGKPVPATADNSTVPDPSNEYWDNPMGHPVWSKEEVEGVVVHHTPPQDTTDWIAYAGVRLLRLGFDIGSGYAFGPINENKLLRRIIFLETVAGIPGMVAATLRHLRSLRIMKRDQGWIHTLLEEAENERMHLLCFLKEQPNPSTVFRGAVLISQGIFWNVFFVSYLISPTLCHRFVGYLEEEAVRTYTGAIQALDEEKLGDWSTKPANDLAKHYWRLGPDAKIRDALLAVRADEANHRNTNHVLADTPKDGQNPCLRRGISVIGTKRFVDEPDQ
eukprot:m.64274 g.64274  ORF g.64274 m.64274 type:complete len:377 (+) comp13572_c0_seq2:230-1360(+)